MTDAEIYLLAAERIASESDHWACVAIWNAAEQPPVHASKMTQSKLMSSYFKPCMWDDREAWGFAFGDDYRNCRITMLLLMSEIAGGTA